MAKWPSITSPFRNHRLALTDALHFLHAAMEIIKRLQQNQTYLPEESDLILLSGIDDSTQEMRLRVMHLNTCFLRRLSGDPDPPFP